MVCEAFTCPPSVALAQDWPTVLAVLEYRAASRAVSLFNSGRQGSEALAREPALGDLLVEMHRAQTDTETTTDALLADMASRGDDGERG